MLRCVSVAGVLLLITLVAPRAFLISAEPASSQAASRKNDPVSTATEIRLIDPGWWPTKGTPARDQYVGSETCGHCHKDVAATQTNTPMAHAVKPATADAFTNMPSAMHFRAGSYDYSLSQTATGAEYSTSNGAIRISGRELGIRGPTIRRYFSVSAERDLF
jgi:hypothetical protein